MSLPTKHQLDLSRKVLRSIDNRIFKLTILPTERCNFRCTYCYEDFARPRMTRPIVDGLKALLTTRSADLKILDLRWFGGEPLLALDIVKEISRHAQGLSRSQSDLQFVSGITTNAYLLKRSVFEELIESDVRSYQISLDGYGADHDKSRRRADGAGTFDTIWNNLLEARSVKEDFSIMLRVHFTPSTFDGIKKLVSEINREFGDDKRFRVFFKAIARLGGPNNDEIERSPWQWQLKAKAELTQLIKRGDDGITDPTVSAYVCYAAEPNALVVRSDGTLARCTVAFDDPRNNVGFLRPDGSLDIDDETSRIWFKGLETMDQKTLYCPLSTIGPAPVKSADVTIPLSKVREEVRLASI